MRLRELEPCFDMMPGDYPEQVKRVLIDCGYMEIGPNGIDLTSMGEDFISAVALVVTAGIADKAQRALHADPVLPCFSCVECNRPLSARSAAELAPKAEGSAQ